MNILAQEATQRADFPPDFLDRLTRAVEDRGARKPRTARDGTTEIPFRCPRPDHEDANPSATWNPDSGVWWCYACDVGGGALELADMLNVDKPEMPKKAGPAMIIARYDYVRDGVPVFRVVKAHPKAFWQERPDGRGGWIKRSVPAAERFVYHFDAIRAAAKSTPVYVVEGEKDVHTLERHGFLATTSPGGARGWEPHYANALAGHPVIILPDNDQPGRRYASDVAPDAYNAGCAVKVVDLPGLPEKGDVSDWMRTHTPDDLRRIVDSAPAWTPAAQPEPLEASTPEPAVLRMPEMISAADLMAKHFAEPTWAVPGIIAEGLTLFVGAPKIGKSWLALNIGIAVASGGRAIGQIPVSQGEVLYLALEDTQRRLQNRLRTTLQGEPAPAGLTLVTEWPPLADGGAAMLEAWLNSHPDARLIIVDTFQRIRGPVKSNNSLYAEDYAAAGAFKRIADAYGVPIVLIHHTRKATADDPQDMISGTHGLAGAADAACILRKQPGKADAALYVRGRDVPEADHALTFDPDTCLWNLLGDASEYRLSEERRQIIDLLRLADEPLPPRKIAEAIGKKDGATRKLLYTMAKAGEVDNVGGAYRLPFSTGNSGNSGNGWDVMPKKPMDTGTSGSRGVTATVTALPLSRGNGNSQNPRHSGVTGVTPSTTVTTVTGVTSTDIEAGEVAF